MTTVSTENLPRTIKLVGGQLSLDFTNTVSWRGREIPEEYLNTYQDLLNWSILAGILGEDEFRNMNREGSIQPEASKRVLERAVELREVIYRIFSAKISKGIASDADLIAMNRELREALSRLRLSPEGDGFTLDFGWGGGALDQMLWPVARAASDLLTSDSLDRLRRCAAEDCGWLFLDTSRNRSRRWCNMKDCGNRSKARSFYNRKQGKKSSHVDDSGLT
jgi:predicted RNA-binding Zn ribbon-like protein